MQAPKAEATGYTWLIVQSLFPAGPSIRRGFLSALVSDLQTTARAALS
jgi:hypothetical protein